MTQDKVIPLGVPRWVTYNDSFICSAFTKHLLLPTSQLQASRRSGGRAHTLESESCFAPGMRRDPGLNFCEPRFSNAKIDMVKVGMDFKKIKTN